ncbi:MAG: hypothetical protein ACQESK_00860 [Bacteroidota bacterium]
MRNLVLSFLIICTFLYSGAQETKSPSEKHLAYLNEEASETDVDKNQFYYVAKASDSTFLDNIQPSLIAFVKGEKSVSIDELEGKDVSGKSQLNNSCGIDALTKEMIDEHLNEEKTYEGLVIKRIEDQASFAFEEDKIIGVMMYSKKIRYAAAPYLEKLAELKEKHGIDFILLTVDTEEMQTLSDSYQNVDIGM